MPKYVEMFDFELVDLLKDDDHQAFTALYDRYWDKLYAVAYHRVNNVSEAEDIVQEVFFSLWKRRAILDLKNGISTYFSIAVKYQVINRLAKEGVKQVYKEAVLDRADTDENSVDVWLAEKELMYKLEECISKLPEKCRLVFEKSRKEGKSTKKIADELNISTKTVEAHITKALSTLRSSLKVSAPLLFLILNQ